MNGMEYLYKAAMLYRINKEAEMEKDALEPPLWAEQAGDYIQDRAGYARRSLEDVVNEAKMRIALERGQLSPADRLAYGARRMARPAEDLGYDAAYKARSLVRDARRAMEQDPVVSAFGPDARGALNGVERKISNGLDSVRGAVVDPVVDGVQSLGRGIKNNIIDPVSNGASNLYNGAGEVYDELGNRISNATSGARESISSAGSKVKGKALDVYDEAAPYVFKDELRVKSQRNPQIQAEAAASNAALKQKLIQHLNNNAIENYDGQIIRKPSVKDMSYIRKMNPQDAIGGNDSMMDNIELGEPVQYQSQKRPSSNQYKNRKSNPDVGSKPAPTQVQQPMINAKAMPVQQMSKKSSLNIFNLIKKAAGSSGFKKIDKDEDLPIGAKDKASVSIPTVQKKEPIRQYKGFTDKDGKIYKFKEKRFLEKSPATNGALGGILGGQKVIQNQAAQKPMDKKGSLNIFDLIKMAAESKIAAEPALNTGNLLALSLMPKGSVKMKLKDDYDESGKLRMHVGNAVDGGIVSVVDGAGNVVRKFLNNTYGKDAPHSTADSIDFSDIADRSIDRIQRGMIRQNAERSVGRRVDYVGGPRWELPNGRRAILHTGSELERIRALEAAEKESVKNLGRLSGDITERSIRRKNLGKSMGAGAAGGIVGGANVIDYDNSVIGAIDHGSQSAKKYLKNKASELGDSVNAKAMALKNTASSIGDSVLSSATSARNAAALKADELKYRLGKWYGENVSGSVPVRPKTVAAPQVAPNLAKRVPVPTNTRQTVPNAPAK